MRKKGLLYLYGFDFFAVISIPFILVVSAKFSYYPVLDNVSFWATFWLITAIGFIIFAALMSIYITKAKAKIMKDDYSKDNSTEVVLILAISLAGIGLGLTKNIIPANYLWDILIVYWIMFLISILRSMRSFLSQCRDAKILF